MNVRTVRTVHAREDIPPGLTLFLAGPTPRSDSIATSWRRDARAEIHHQWREDRPLTILSPESRDGVRAKEYDDQVEWEAGALDAATAILFWIPRDLRTLPGFTTNVEFGLYVQSGRAVLGAPPGCANPERNRYLIWTARRYCVPVLETLPETVHAALEIVRGAPRA